MPDQDFHPTGSTRLIRTHGNFEIIRRVAYLLVEYSFIRLSVGISKDSCDFRILRRVNLCLKQVFQQSRYLKSPPLTLHLEILKPSLE